MTLVGRSPIGRKSYPGPDNLVHGHQIGCCDQCHEAGNELTVSLDPVIDPDVPVFEAFRSNVSNHVLRKAIKLGSPILFHFRYFPVAAQPEDQWSTIPPQLESEFDSASQSPYYYARLTLHPCGDQNSADRKNKNDCANLVICWRH